MPNIIQYEAKGEITPSDKGIQAAELAGRRLGAFGQQIKGDIDQFGQQIEDHMAVMETSELYKTGTELKLNLQTKYDQESGLPENRNDPHFGDRFMAEVGPMLDQWGSSVHTKRGQELAAVMKGNIRNDIFNHVSAGQSEMDSAHVEDNLNQTINTLGAGLQLDPSVGNLNRTIGAAKDAIQGMTAAIPDVGTRERVAEELTAQRIPQLVVARYNGVFESIKQQVGATGDPAQSAAYDQAGKEIAAQVGFQYLSPELQAKLSTARDEAVRQGQELYKARDVQQKKAQDDAVDSALLPVETSMFQPNGAGGVTMVVPPDALDAVQRAARMPGAERQAPRINSLLNALHTATQDASDGKEIATDHPTYVGLAARIGSTTNPLTKAEVDDARSKHQLSNDDWHFLREAASDSKTANPKINHAFTELNEWLTKVKPLIDTSDAMFGKLDPTGTQKYVGFSWGAQSALRRAIASGTDPEAAVESLTNPANPNGLWHKMPPKETMQQGTAAVLAAIHGSTQPASAATAPPAKAGESPADYLKRTSQ